jgi:hypothetical protein
MYGEEELAQKGQQDNKISALKHRIGSLLPPKKMILGIIIFIVHCSMRTI